MPPPRVAAVLALAAGLAGRAASAQSDSTFVPRRPLYAVGQAAVINVFVNRVDAWVFNQDWARAGTRAWGKNLKLGWEWDEDAFPTNMFAHPYHGSLYFNSGRSNGLGYFEAVPISFFGSWSWEYFGETYRPSLNDWFMTSFGGITLGEMFHRISSSIRDNGDRGRSRTWRELAALPMDPIGGLNRIVRGEWKRVGRNPPEHDPGSYVLRVGAGARFAEGLISDSGVAKMGAVVVDLLYGDQFAQEYKDPFDVFGARLVLSSNGGFQTLRASGRLYGSNLNNPTKRIRHVLAVNQRYDYYKNPAQSIGGQSVEIGVNSRWRFGSKGYGLRTSLFFDFVVLGAIDAPGTGLGERTYDFGPGAGSRWEIALERNGARFFRILGQEEFIHTVSGASADHFIHVSGLELTLPLAKGFGVSGHAYVFHRESRYSEAQAGTRRDVRDYPEARLLFVWTKAGFK
jgi:hypothetical protein